MMRNVDVVRRGYEHFASTGDLLDEIYAPGFVSDMSHFHGWPEQPIYEGVDGAREFLRAWTEAWDDWEIEVESLHEAGDQVDAILHQRCRSKATGLPVEMRLGQLYRLRDVKETRMEMYAAPAEAMRAAGLIE